MLLHPRFAAKRFGEHGGGVVVAVAREVADRYLGIWNTQLDQALDLARIHRHGSFSHSVFRRSGRRFAAENASNAPGVRPADRPYKPAASPYPEKTYRETHGERHRAVAPFGCASGPFSGSVLNRRVTRGGTVSPRPRLKC